MTPSENISLMKRWFREVWVEGKNDIIYELVAPDAVLMGQRGAQVKMQGPAEFAAFADQIRLAFSGMEMVVEDAIAADDKVVVRWSATMNHSGEGMGAPTGKRVRLSGVSIARMENGKIVEGWDSWDQLGMLEQIGAYVAPNAEVLAKTA